MFNKILILLAATITLAGCSSTPVARKPGSFTAITFPVSSERWENGSVQLATSKKYGCGKFSDNILPASVDKDFSVDIEGNQDTFFHVTRVDAKIACNESGFFYASKGNEYTLNVKAHGQQCIVTLTEKTPGGTQSKINTYPAFVSRADGIKVCTSKERLY
jgi:pectin methylesterase-like acyl-CoA thioesterase